MKTKEEYLQIIDELLALLSNGQHQTGILNQVHFRTITFLNLLYGKTDPRIDALADYKSKKYDPQPTTTTFSSNFSKYLEGLLRGIRSDVEQGLIFNLEKQVTGAVVADFLLLAKEAMGNDYKDVAAVLVSASIEDALKRFATMHGLAVHDEDMAAVINALKSKGLLKGPQASVISSHTKLRNKAFHAKWGEIEKPEIHSLISFTESFILENLS